MLPTSRRYVTSTLAVLLTVSALVACMKIPDNDWRAEVTSVMEQISNTTSPISGNSPSTSKPNTERLHPITNPDAQEIPSVSYGNTRALVYGDKVYLTVQTLWSRHILSSVNLSDLISYDPDEDQYNCLVPRSTPLCFDPFCQHRVYEENNEIVCPLFFDLRKSGPNAASSYRPIFCIDYSESKGESPVFYICAPEPEYRVVGQQVILKAVSDLAIYRYDPASGERKIITEDLSASIYMMVICGDYIIFGDEGGLTAINKSGEAIWTMAQEADTFRVLDYADGVLYYVNSLGKLYSADIHSGGTTCIYTYDYSGLDEIAVKRMLTRAASPAGMTIDSGYLYYCDDCVEVEGAIEGEERYTSSIYRIPLSDLSAEPELIVAGQCFESAIFGIRKGVLYFTPTYRRDMGNDKIWVNGRGLASVNLSDQKVTVLEQNAVDMPDITGAYRNSITLNSGFLMGHTSRFGGADSYMTIYHFETGDILYLSMYPLVYGKTKW